MPAEKRTITIKWKTKNAQGVVDAKGKTDWEIMICYPEPDDEYYGTGIYLSCCPIRKDGTKDKGAAFMWDMRYACETDPDKLVDRFVQDYFGRDGRKIAKERTKYYVA